MMNTQFQVFHGGTFQMHWGQSSRIGAADQGVHRLASGEAMSLGRSGGDLTVVDGRVWLTRDGDLGDHFVEPGQKLRLAAHENAVIEAAHTGDTITVRWTPRRLSIAGALLAAPLRGLALAAGSLAEAFSALACSAAESARRTQGCNNGSGSVATLDSLKSMR
jgi:hypothetical protein